MKIIIIYMILCSGWVTVNNIRWLWKQVMRSKWVEYLKSEYSRLYGDGSSVIYTAQSISSRDIKVLEFIYLRLAHVHSENEKVDYMIYLKKNIKKVKKEGNG